MGFLLYNTFEKKPVAPVPILEMMNVEPKLRPIAPKTIEPPPPKPPEKVETRLPDAPKLTSKPKHPVAIAKPEPKHVRPVSDTVKPVKDVPQEVQQLTTTIVANVPSDPRLSFWAMRVKTQVELLWNPPTGIGIQGQAKTVVSFQVGRKGGSVSAVSVTLTSGNVMLDQLAERTILRLDHVPLIPENFPDDILQVSYEFLYQGQ